ncbi:MAG: alpha/beta fold hydrolase [Candidatus Omnitrophica bacterium]|nr:alpha/beta fold hydrolase [Candidatus Omnitrophota bacterium]
MKINHSSTVMPLALTGTLLTSDNQKIAYRHYKAGHDKVIVIAHGFYNSKDAVILTKLAESLHDEYDVFMFDFRGHGKSGGLYTWTSREGRDLKAVLDYIEGKYKKVGMLAFSFGASVAINTLAHDTRVNSLVCVSSASDPGKTDYQFWKLDLKGDLAYTLFTPQGWKGRGFRPGPFWLTKEKPIDNAAQIQIPIFYIHGEKDWVIKPWHSRALYDKTQSKKKLVMIKNGPHAEYLTRDYGKQFITEVKSWFKETLSKEQR